jgi:hypothetical protein
MAGEFEMLPAELENGPTVRRTSQAEGWFYKAATDALEVASRPTPTARTTVGDIAKLQRKQAAAEKLIKSLPGVDPEADRQSALRKAVADIDALAEKAIAVGRPDLACRFEAYRNRMAAGL